MPLALPPLAAEQIFNIGPFAVTNALFNAFLALVLFTVFAFFLNLGIKKYYLNDKAPKGLVNFFESILEILLGQIDSVTHDRKKTLKFLPIVGGALARHRQHRPVEGWRIHPLFAAGQYRP
jgi:F0F1-type ATP synthase membrane subunit a